MIEMKIICFWTWYSKIFTYWLRGQWLVHFKQKFPIDVDIFHTDDVQSVELVVVMGTSEKLDYRSRWYESTIDPLKWEI